MTKTRRMVALQLLVAILCLAAGIGYLLTDKLPLSAVWSIVSISWFVLAYSYWNTR